MIAAAVGDDCSSPPVGWNDGSGRKPTGQTRGAVALLGLEQLTPRVRAAFEDGRIPAEAAGEDSYRQWLAAALERPADLERFDEHSVGFIEDMVETLERFVVNEEADPFLAEASDDDLTWRPPFLPGLPVRNPWRDIGRNDPCPCGSGKKFKKCCIP